MDSIISQKSLTFAVRIVKAAKYLQKEKHEYELAKQLLRSGTAIGANVAESKYAQSDADFISKLKIALKESSETRYWLKLLELTDILTKDEAGSLEKDVTELIKILTAIIKTTQSKAAEKDDEAAEATKATVEVMAEKRTVKA